MRGICGRQSAGLAILAVVFSLAACGSASPTAATTPPSAVASTLSTTGTTTPSSAAASTLPGHGSTTSAARPSAAFVPMQTAAGGEFLSPSSNISCEVNYHRDGLTGAYCQTITPARSVTMDTTGHYTTCTGEQCLGDSGEDTPTLAYGSATGVGPFRCESAAAGITCVADGRGFQISATAITPVAS